VGIGKKGREGLKGRKGRGGTRLGDGAPRAKLGKGIVGGWCWGGPRRTRLGAGRKGAGGEWADGRRGK
jgi:hypothetical protein